VSDWRRQQCARHQILTCRVRWRAELEFLFDIGGESIDQLIQRIEDVYQATKAAKAAESSASEAWQVISRHRRRRPAGAGKTSDAICITRGNPHHSEASLYWQACGF
jgi:uncharacterized protein with von Willebrand factor type A (vWA) domain